jgi:hypothetical protein
MRAKTKVLVYMLIARYKISVDVKGKYASLVRPGKK